jgi:hypothetical protein
MVCAWYQLRQAGRAGRVRAPGRPLEGIEDLVQADPELVAVTVAGPEDMPGGQLGKVRVRITGKLPADLLRNPRRLIRGPERRPIAQR